jgi:hypothetical protein
MQSFADRHKKEYGENRQATYFFLPDIPFKILNGEYHSMFKILVIKKTAFF